MDRLIAHLRDELNIKETLQADTPLFSSGIVDSFRVAALLTVLEARYGIRIDPRDIGVDNFDTPAQILKFLQQRS